MQAGPFDTRFETFDMQAPFRAITGVYESGSAMGFRTAS
jgi:hypothetical protein